MNLKLPGEAGGKHRRGRSHNISKEQAPQRRVATAKHLNSDLPQEKSSGDKSRISHRLTLRSGLPSALQKFESTRINPRKSLDPAVGRAFSAGVRRNSSVRYSTVKGNLNLPEGAGALDLYSSSSSDEDLSQENKSNKLFRPDDPLEK